MATVLLFLILESLTLKDIVYLVITVVGALWLWKSGLPQQLFTSSNQLLALRTTERDDALRDRDKWKTKAEELDEDNRVLRREITQRIEINLQDQEELRELKKLLKK